MAGAKEIRSKIRSVKNTQKITRAMEMVAASKMRKSQERMATSKPYATKIRQVIGHLARSHAEYRHPYLEQRAPKRIGFIIVSSDRGLCGGLNNNLFKSALHAMREWQQRQVDVDLCLIGSKADVFFRRHGGRVLGQVTHIGDKPNMSDLLGVVQTMLSAYDENKIDAVFIVSNEFVNTMTQRPMVQQLLPLLPDATEVGHASYWDYIYEPDARTLLDLLLKRFIESQSYQAVIENIACEQAARMIAMKNASDNAGDIISQLQLVYNKARQAAITQELSEIVAGAAAV